MASPDELRYGYQEENQNDHEQESPDLPYPTSMESMGTAPPMGGMAPPPVSLPALPPPPMANPGLAAGYGMMAGLQGQVGNPYLAQIPQIQAQAATQYNQMLQAQTRQMQMLQLQQRIDIERKKQQTLEQEAPLKLAGALSKVDTPVAQEISAREYARYLKNTLGITVNPQDMIAANMNMKKEQVDGIDAQLELVRGKTPPGTRPDFSSVLSVYPKVPISYLESRYQILGDPNARGVIGIKPIQDPAQVAAEAVEKQAKTWIGSHQEFGNDHKLYAKTNDLFRQLTGRQLFNSTEQERPLVEKLRLESEQTIKAEAELEKGLTNQQLAQRLAELKAQGKEKTPLYQQYLNQINLLTPPIAIPAFGGLGARGDVLMPPGQPAGQPASGQGGGGRNLIKDPILPPTEAGAAQVPFGTTVAEAARIGKERGTIPLTAPERTQIDSLNAIGAILDSIEKDIKDLSPVKTPTERLTGSLARGTEIYGQTNPKAAAAYSRLEGSLAKLARAMGEVGTMTEGDINRARELWPVVAPGVRMGGPGGLIPIPQLPDTDAVFAEKMKGLRDLFRVIKSRIGQTPEGAHAPPNTTPSPMPAVRSPHTPQTPTTTPRYPEGQRLRGSDGKIYRIKNGVPVPE